MSDNTNCGLSGGNCDCANEHSCKVATPPAMNTASPTDSETCKPAFVHETGNMGEPVERCSNCGTYRGNPCRLERAVPVGQGSATSGEAAAIERATAEQEAFEAWSKREGAFNLTPAGGGYCEDFRFPATYYYSNTETAWRAWANGRAALAASAEQSNSAELADALSDLDKVPYLIVFDDTDRANELVIGGTRARYRFKQISGSWNAHLFAKVASNSRDDPHYSANFSAPVAERAASIEIDGRTYTADEIKGRIKQLDAEAEAVSQQHAAGAKRIEELEALLAERAAAPDDVSAYKAWLAKLHPSVANIDPFYAFKAGRAAAPASVPEELACWSCKRRYTECQRLDADGNCPHCGVEIEIAAPEVAQPAAQGESIDTPEFGKMLMSIREAKHAIALGVRTERLVAHVHEWGASQRRAGQLSMSKTIETWGENQRKYGESTADAKLVAENRALVERLRAITGAKCKYPHCGCDNRASCSVKARALATPAPTAAQGEPGSAVRDVVERAAKICESACICDNDEDNEAVNWILRNRAAQIRALAAPTAGEASARTDGPCNSALRAEPAGQHGWISVGERLPPKGKAVLVFTPGRKFGDVILIDCWDEQREDPMGMGGPTIITGEMWNEHEFEEISHWMPLPATPDEKSQATRSRVEGENTCQNPGAEVGSKMPETRMDASFDAGAEAHIKATQVGKEGA